MLDFLRKKCIEETQGSILNKRKINGFWFIGVGYSVKGKNYVIDEQLTYHTKDNYMCTSYCSAISNLNIGGLVKVCYDPKKPRRAYLPENDGVYVPH